MLDQYVTQVRLLLSVLPDIAREVVFALKGGTAINLFHKVSKMFLEIKQFHGHCERLVKQELFAHFNLIAMTRLFTNRDDRLEQAARAEAGKPTSSTA